MSIKLHVSLLSGRSCTIETGLDVDVRVLKQRAQSALAVFKGKLGHPSGTVLDEANTIGDSELRHDDILSLHIQPSAIHAAHDPSTHKSTFVVVLGDGSVVTWGDAEYVAAAVLCKIS